MDIENHREPDDDCECAGDEAKAGAERQNLFQQQECRQSGDTGYCYGNSSLFGNLRERDADCPNCARSVFDLLAPPFMSGPVRALPYDALAAVIPPFQSAVLIYDLNLRLAREPATTNAPDQGYPAIRNLRRVPLATP